MKKIGILTLVFYNYGTRLQSYALCEILKTLCSQDTSIEVIDINTTWKDRGVNTIAAVWKGIKKYGFHSLNYFYNYYNWVVERRKIRQMSHEKEEDDRKLMFANLISRIPYTEKRYSYDDIRKGNMPKYDIVIVGSDQVWNEVKVGNQDIYMLDYYGCDSRKLTYAASFGMTSFPKGTRKDYQKRIRGFESLLMREEEGVKMCQQLGRKDAKLVLDPTLLLDVSDYEKLIQNEGGRNCDYVLVYSLNYSLKVYDEAYSLARKNNYKMIVLKRSFCPPNISNYEGAQELYCESPESFLSLIKHAKCVVTNSYHALIFSIVFSTDFYLYLDNADEENSRLLSLVSLCNLQKRVFWETGHLPRYVEIIDYRSVQEIIKKEREKSISLLRESLRTNE